MNVADIILGQLGGNMFLAMTGAKNLLADGNTLRMQIGKNASKANRLWITLENDDTYKMDFFKYTAGRYNSKTGTFSSDKRVDVASYEMITADMLTEIFERVTGLYTRL